MSQVRNNNKSGKSLMISPAGREAEVISSGDDVETVSITSGALQSNRIIPCEPLPDTMCPVAGETTVIIHSTGERETPANHKRSSKCNPHVYSAMRLLMSYGFIPVRLAESILPLSIIGFKESSPLLVLVISSRKPIPSAKKLREEYEEQVLYLCSMAGSIQYRIMIWVHSPKCSWGYYRISPGGLEYDWKFPGTLEK